MSAPVVGGTRGPAQRGSVQSVRSQPQPLAGFGTQLWFTVRRDRIRGLAWFVPFVGLVVGSGASVIPLYHTPAQLQNYADLAHGNVAIKALLGRGYGLDNPNQGAVVMDEVNLFTLVAVALMCILLMVRHTRTDEESDRAELLRAGPVGRHAALAAACVWVGSLALAIAAGVAVGLIALGLAPAGSLAFGAAIVGTAVVFIAVTSITAQLAASARAATAAAGAVLGASYLVRAVGDMRGDWLTWVSPLGWSQGIRAYADERWWVLGPLAIAAAGLVAAAFLLSARRDLGAGAFAQRPGAREASRWLTTPLALAARLQRGSLIGWTIGVALAGFFLGSIGDLADTIAENDTVAKIMTAGGASALDGYLATMLLLTALLASSFAISAMLAAPREESLVRADPVLATPISRVRWLGSHIAMACLGSAWMLAVAGLSTGLGYAAATGDLSRVLPLAGASLAYLPATLALIGVAVALIGGRPRWSGLAWLGVAVGALVGFLGETLRMPQWLQDTSAFEHIPALPLDTFSATPLALLLVVAIALLAGGTAALRRRDIAG